MRQGALILFAFGFIYLLYYFFVQPFEFQVNFHAKTTSGNLVETIRIWNRSLQNGQIVEVDSLAGLQQRISIENRNYLFKWFFKVKNDSITQVTVQIHEPGRSILNKVLVPFTQSFLEGDAEKLIGELYRIVQVHLSLTKVEIVGKERLSSTFCICKSMETSQIDKAQGMMREYPLLTSFIDQHKLQPNGPPMIRINKWNHSKGVINFEFCFPIIKVDSLPSVAYLAYKTFDSMDVLKAKYNGNYITSDRAWYELQQYAYRNKLKVNHTPIEYFHDNPNLGFNQSTWRADIYMPLMND